MEIGLSFYYNAFFDLNTCRPVGTVEGPISWLTIDEYCRRQDIDGEEREDMIYHILSLDNVYFAYKARKRATEAPPPPAVTKKTGK